MFAVFGIVSGWSCAGDLENPERFGFLLDSGAPASTTDSATANSEPGDVSPPQCLTMLFETRCGMPGCHAAGATGQLDLVSPAVADRLIDQKSSSTQCAGRVLVATDGAQSLLLQKLDGVPPCGLPMPLSGEKLNAQELECVSSWVEAVAIANGGGS